MSNDAMMSNQQQQQQLLLQQQLLQQQTQQQTQKEQIGVKQFQQREKVNSELFAMTYGAFVIQILRDSQFDCYEGTKKLKEIGRKMGNRLIEDYLASVGKFERCESFRDAVDSVSECGLRMFVNAKAKACEWQGEKPFEQCLICIEDLRGLTDFVELPEKYQKELSYCEIVLGVIEGCLEAVNVNCKCVFVKDSLRADLSIGGGGGGGGRNSNSNNNSNDRTTTATTTKYVCSTVEGERILRQSKFAIKVKSLGTIEEPYPFKDD
jgi:trafficking protein particle complex subunit 3